jgi:pimeloyl-ACP methyl ester carboxylesterase
MKRIGLAIAAAVVVLLLAAAAWLWTPDRPLATLEAKYLRSPKDMIEVAGVRLHVRDDGPRTAPAIIMIHGFGASLQTWEPWAEALDPKFRVIRFDLPGAGLSSPDPRGDYTDARTIAVLLALMDRLGVAKASLIGNSIGGRIAWTFAAEYPDRVDKLVLISPDGFASPGFAYGQAPKVPATLGLTRYVLPKSLLRASLKPAYGDPAALTDPTVDRYYELMLAPGVRQALLQRLKETVLVDPRPLLHAIKAPVLLLWGERDGMIPFSNARAYLQTLPDARLAALPTLGHVPQEEAPAISLRPVEAFLSDDEASHGASSRSGSG